MQIAGVSLTFVISLCFVAWALTSCGYQPM